MSKKLKTGFIELTKEQFIKRLMKAGWTKEDAESEWDKTMRGEYDD